MRVPPHPRVLPGGRVLATCVLARSLSAHAFSLPRITLLQGHLCGSPESGAGMALVLTEGCSFDAVRIRRLCDASTNPCYYPALNWSTVCTKVRSPGPMSAKMSETFAGLALLVDTATRVAVCWVHITWLSEPMMRPGPCHRGSSAFWCIVLAWSPELSGAVGLRFLCAPLYKHCFFFQHVANTSGSNPDLVDQLVLR